MDILDIFNSRYWLWAIHHGLANIIGANALKKLLNMVDNGSRKISWTSTGIVKIAIKEDGEVDLCRVEIVGDTDFGEINIIPLYYNCIGTTIAHSAFIWVDNTKREFELLDSNGTIENGEECDLAAEVIQFLTKNQFLGYKPLKTIASYNIPETNDRLGIPNEGLCAFWAFFLLLRKLYPVGETKKNLENYREKIEDINAYHPLYDSESLIMAHLAVFFVMELADISQVEMSKKVEEITRELEDNLSSWYKNQASEMVERNYKRLLDVTVENETNKILRSSSPGMSNEDAERLAFESSAYQQVLEYWMSYELRSISWFLKQIKWAAWEILHEIKEHWNPTFLVKNENIDRVADSIEPISMKYGVPLPSLPPETEKFMDFIYGCPLEKYLVGGAANYYYEPEAAIIEFTEISSEKKPEFPLEMLPFNFNGAVWVSYGEIMEGDVKWLEPISEVDINEWFSQGFLWDPTNNLEL